MRLIDLLEMADGMFIIRETTFSDGRTRGVSVANIWLKPHELTKLGDAIPRVMEARS
jgi:hypothetical protein